MNILAFGEFVASNDFSILLHRLWHLPNSFIELGAYQQGIPVRPATDFIWGTEAGLRTFPILSALYTLQRLFPTAWDYIYLFLCLFLPLISFLIAIRFIKKIDIFSVCGAIFYAGNVWIVDRLFTGFWQLNIVYAFLPFLITIPIKITSLKNERWLNQPFWIALYALCASIIIIAQPHFLIMVGIFSFAQILFLVVKKEFVVLKKLLLFYSSVLPLFLLLNAYFFIPSILYAEKQFTASNQYFSLGSVIFNGQSSQIQNILRLQITPFPFKESPWTWIEYLQFFPMVFTLFLFILNKKKTWLYIFCLFIFLFLAKGLNDPWQSTSKWIYQSLFFMHFFRDPTRFLGGVAMFMSFIIADFSPQKSYKRWLKLGYVIFFSVIIIVTNYKSFSEPKSDILRRVTIPDSYADLQHFTNTTIKNRRDGRVLPLPDFQGIGGYSWYKNPAPLSSGTIFDTLVPLQLPLTSTASYPDTYSNQLTAFLYTRFTNSYNPNYLTPLGIKYIVADKSVTVLDSTKKVATTSGKIMNAKGSDYTPLFKNNTLNLFENKTYASLVSTEKPIFAIGSLNTISKNYQNGSARPIILLNQMVNNKITTLRDLKNEDLFIDVKDPILVLTAERLSDSYSVDILKAGWNYDKVFSNYEAYKMPYIQQNGDLFTSGRSVSSQTPGNMRVLHSLPKGKYKILLKALTDSAPSFLTISMGNRVKNISLNTNQQLSWIDAGEVDIKNNLSFLTLTKRDTNLIVIDKLIIAPENTFNSEKKNVQTLLSYMNILKDLPKERNKQVTGELITEDKVQLLRPTKYLTYRFSYGNYWTSNKPSIKFISDLYGMTFIAKKEGITEIEYSPNYVYRVSLVLSFTSLGVLLIFLLYRIYNYTRHTYFISPN